MLPLGTLDGLTILRFTHAFRDGGGVERYLEDLNRCLLIRNSVTIIQLYLPEQGSDSAPLVEKIGKGRLIRVPMTAEYTEQATASQRERGSDKVRVALKDFFRNHILYSPLMPQLFRRIVIRKNFRLYDREPTDAGEKLANLLKKYKISLIIIHLAGGFGSAQIIREAQLNGIPFLIFNHFSNEWFNRIGLREQVRDATGVGGVSSIGVPRYVWSRYTNLLDGIDTDFFSKEKVKLNGKEGNGYVVLLPSRITPGKGHFDLLKAASNLISSGIGLRIVFGGREDSQEFKNGLIDFISRSNLWGSVTFTGHLRPEALRDWYASADVVVLPSYSEGLGRVLLEGQAMERPVLAYRTGGVADAMVDGKSGYLIRRGDVAGLEKRLSELLLNPEKRAVMGSEGRKHVERKFSHTALAERHEKWYLGVIAN